MKKISVKNLVEFRRKTERGKRTFVDNIKSNKPEPPSEGGGDYWITSLSAIRKCYKDDDINVIEDKIEELLDKLNNTKATITKNMYKKNIDILQAYKNIDVKTIRPIGKLFFLKKSDGNRLLTVKGLQIETKPSHIYTFGTKDEEKVGAVWFIAKKSGYNQEELGIFCETLYKFLKFNYIKRYQITPKFCVIVDMASNQIVNYSQIEDGTIPVLLNSTLDSINKLM